MKRRPGILLLFFGVIAVTALSSNVSYENLELLSGHNTLYPDSSNSMKWLRADSVSLELLPPSSGIRFYRDGIVYLSSSRFEEKMIPDHLSFGQPDARYSPLHGDTIGNPLIFSPTRVFPFPCDGITFSKDFKSMYFTKYARDSGVEKIYHAKLDDGDSKNGNWIVDPDPLNFCNDGWTYTHPALSTDGNFMVFASDRPGTSGGLDLYVTTLKEGAWSEPVNLGDAVNSTYNESYPFLDSGNNLYFSSDDAQGFGGYDIYVCKFKGNTWDKPINLSTPVNTVNDDIAFSIDNKDSKTAYFTIRQSKGKKALHLIRITFSKERPDTLLTLPQFFTRPDISQMVILALEPAVQATDPEAGNSRLRAARDPSGKDSIEYRVQFMTSFNPRTRSTIEVNGVNYNVTEFLYSGAYRLCVGKFIARPQARALQTLLRNNNYPRATVVEIRNGEFTPADEPGDSSVADKTVPDTTSNRIVNTKLASTSPNQNVVPVTRKDSVKVSVKKDTVVYRVQIITSNVSKGKRKIQVDNSAYNTFEYFYAGAYRTCVGEFLSVAPALELLKSCRKAGYPQSFVVAFRNNIRSTDPALFKSTVNTTQNK